MRLIILCLLLNPILLKAQTPAIEAYPIPNFSQGVVTRYNPALIPENSVQWAENVYFDVEGGITRRKGYSQFNSSVFPDSQSVRGIWPFTADDGTRYILALSSETIYKATTDGEFTAISGLNGFSTVSDMDATTLSGKIWFTNGTDAVSTWDGSSTSTVTEAPLGGLIESYRNRIIIAGKSGELSNIYMSENLDGTEWTIGPTLNTSPINLPIGGINGKPITCLYAGYKDILWAWTEDETWGIYGFGYKDFSTRQISREVGCIEDKSVQEKDGKLYWMSRRGVEEATGQTFNRISDGNKDIFDTIINNSALLRLKLYSSQAEWEEGTLGNEISATISPASIVPATFTVTETQDYEFDEGTLVDVSTENVNYENSIVLSTSSIESTFDDFSDGNYTSDPIWTCGGNTGDCARVVVDSELLIINGLSWVNGWITLSSPNSLNGIRIQKNIYLNMNTWATYPDPYINITEIFLVADSTTPLNGYYIQITHTHPNQTYKGTLSAKLYKRVSGDDILLGSDNSLSVTGDLPNTYLECNNLFLEGDKYSGTFIASDTSCGLYISGSGFTPEYDNSYYVINSSFSKESTYIDTLTQKYTFYDSTGTYTSKIFDTGISTTIGGLFDANFTTSTAEGTSLDFGIRESTSPNNDLWSALSAITVSTDTQALSLTERYWQFKSTFTTTYSTHTPILADYTLQATTTGQYIGECVTATEISSWGNFQANQIISGNSSIEYYVSTGATCDSVEQSTATWNLQKNNAPITVSTVPYLGIKAVLIPTASSETTKVLDFTANWQSGASRPPLASAMYNNRLYIAYTTNTSLGYNDWFVVYDKNNAPTFLSNINCYSLGLFNRNMYCGDSASTGKIYQLEIGEDDDGDEFTSKIKTKAYAFGDPNAEKEFVKAYAIFSPEENTALDIDLTPKYYLDLSTTAIILDNINTGEDSTAGILVSKIPFSLDNNISGKFLSMEFTNTGKNQPFTLFGLTFYFKKYDVK